MSTIDVEDETILTAIFKDSFPETWKENPDFVQYLAELSSYGIEKLSREPERLAEEKAQILEETQDLAFHNYKTFIETAECSREIFEDFQIIEKHVGNLLHQLPPFSSECENIAKRAQEINASRRMNSLTLQRHTQLLEILEMPQLMDTCVRNGYYEEALELTTHVKRLEKKHYNLPVIANIVDEVKGSTQLMLNQLIQQLRTNIQLPLCLRVIGYLRRMDVFSEAELRIKFLQARDTWFQCIVDGIPTEDAYIHITKIIEASRVHLFDIITQYRAIFSDEDTLVTSSSSQKDDHLQHSSPFYSWLTLKVNQFLTTLECDLSKGVGGRLDSLVGQCMYFSLSFSRIGADFRGLLLPIFYTAALNTFQATLDTANNKFSEMMESYNLMGLTLTGGLAYNMATQPGQLYPPSALLDFQPLANYCNHVLTAFNDLRLCLPISLACDISDRLEKSLMKVNDVILSFHRAEETTLSNTESDHFQHLLQVYIKHLLPYLQKCMATLFPPSQLALTLGLTQADLTSMGNFGSLNIESIQAGISHLLPEKEEDIIEATAMELNVAPPEDGNIEPAQPNVLEPTQQNVVEPAQQNVVEPAQQNVVEPAQQNVPEPTQQNVPEQAQQNVPEPTQQNVPEQAQQNVPEPTQQNVLESAQQNVPEPTQQNVPEPAQQNVPESTQQNVLESAQQSVPEPVQQNVPGFLENIVTKSELTPEMSSAHIPEAATDVSVNSMPEVTSIISPASVPQATPEISPVTISGTTSEMYPAIVPQATPVIPASVPGVTSEMFPGIAPQANPVTPASIPGVIPEISPATVPQPILDVSSSATIPEPNFTLDSTELNLSFSPLPSVIASLGTNKTDPNFVISSDPSTTSTTDLNTNLTTNPSTTSVTDLTSPLVDLDDIKLDETSLTD